MSEVIIFFFDTLRDIWQVIYSNWVLSISFMIAVLGMIIGLINNSKSEK